MSSKNHSILSPRLVMIEGKEKGKLIPLGEGTAVLGRAKGDVVIQDPRISRSHVAIHFDSRTGKLSYTDLKSLNGTLVNGNAAESGELHDGDKLQLGNTVFDIQIMRLDDASSETSLRMKAARKLKGQPQLEEPPRAKDPLDLEPAPDLLDNPSPELQTAPKLENAQTQLVSVMSGSNTRRLRIALLSVVVIAGGIWYLLGDQKSHTEHAPRTMASITELANAGKFEEAQAKAEAMRKQFPESSYTYMALGNLYTATNKNDFAIASYEKAHTLSPAQQLVHIKLIRVYLRAGKPEKASTEKDHLEKLISSGQHNKELFIETASLFMEFKQMMNPPEPAFILAKALQTEYAPESAVGYKLEASIHLDANRSAEALAAMEKARQYDPQDEWLLENMMFTKLLMKDRAAAEKLLDEWMKIKPTATKPLLVSGYLRFNDKDYTKALPLVQKVLAIAAGNPDDAQYPEALDLMGQIQLALNQTAEAANFFKQGCEMGYAKSCENPLVKGQKLPIGNPDENPKTATPKGGEAEPPAVPASGSEAEPSQIAPPRAPGSVEAPSARGSNQEPATTGAPPTTAIPPQVEAPEPAEAAPGPTE